MCALFTCFTGAKVQILTLIKQELDALSRCVLSLLALLVTKVQILTLITLYWYKKVQILTLIKQELDTLSMCVLSLLAFLVQSTNTDANYACTCRTKTRIEAELLTADTKISGLYT